MSIVTGQPAATVPVGTYFAIDDLAPGLVTQVYHRGGFTYLTFASGMVYRAAPDEKGAIWNPSDVTRGSCPPRECAVCGTPWGKFRVASVIVDIWIVPLCVACDGNFDWEATGIAWTQKYHRHVWVAEQEYTVQDPPHDYDPRWTGRTW